MLISLIFYLFWFIFSDRRLVFLYGHLHATPFDFNTSSRYLVTGLVISGVVLLVYTLVGLILQRFGRKLPDWRRNWAVSSLVLPIPVFLLLSVFGQPQLPVLLSLAVILVLLGGLGLAYYLSSYLVDNFKSSILTFFDSLALIGPLSLIPAFMTFGLRKENYPLLVIAPIILIGLGFLWSLIMTWFHKKIKKPVNSSSNNLLFALAVSYLILPFFHYLTSRPGYNYLSNLTNFFGRTWWIQVITFLLVFGLSWLIAKTRRQKDFKNLKNLALLLGGFVIITYGSLYLTADRETDIWICAEDTWVKQGEPNYEQPFPEECGQIDKAMGL